jgi:kynurenine formamidase
MLIAFSFNNRSYTTNLSYPIEISIPQTFDEDQPVAFGVPNAVTFPIMAEGYIGSVAEGSGTNCNYIHMIPHCNGTHTECVGHILTQKVFINEVLTDPILPATVITVEAEAAGTSADHYIPNLDPRDRYITRQKLIDASKDFNFLDALIIRTLPNGDFKKTWDYSQLSPPFFSVEAMEWIKEKKIKHLLVDMPSIDRLWDEGLLACHRIYWDVGIGEKEIPVERITSATITEMIYVPNHVPDGDYLVNIQIPPFQADAAPSRVFLYEVQELQQTSSYF